MTWLEDVIALYGEPQVKPPADQPDGVLIGSGRRCAWVWFPDGVNHALHITNYGGHWETSVGSHTGLRCRFDTTIKPTNEQILALIRLAWEVDA